MPRIRHNAHALCVWVQYSASTREKFATANVCVHGRKRRACVAHVLLFFSFPFAIDIFLNFGWCFIQNHFWLHCVAREISVYCKILNVINLFRWLSCKLGMCLVKWWSDVYKHQIYMVQGPILFWKVAHTHSRIRQTNNMKYRKDHKQNIHYFIKMRPNLVD